MMTASSGSASAGEIPRHLTASIEKRSAFAKFPEAIAREYADGGGCDAGNISAALAQTERLSS